MHSERIHIMENKKICIATDCSCDLPTRMLKENGIQVMYFYIRTERGCFREGEEITAVNIFEYHNENSDRPAISLEPVAEEFYGFFTKQLTRFDEVIYITTGNKISMAYKNATDSLPMLAKDGNDGRVHIFDSMHLSTGIGHLALYAARLAREGRNVQEIISGLEIMRPKISTTFMADSADYLYRNGKVSKGLATLCRLLKFHPVLEMRDGKLKLIAVKVGAYESCAMRYVACRLKKLGNVRKDLLFITHAGCTAADMKMVKGKVEERAYFDKIEVTSASATISCNSGPRTFGLLYVNK